MTDVGSPSDIIESAANGDGGAATAVARTNPSTPVERLTRPDWLLLVVVISLQAVWVGRQTSDYFFVDDFWAMLGDGHLEFGDLVQDHGGHWTAYHRIAANLYYDLFGLSYWPGVGVVGAITWGALALYAAWAVNRLGGSRLAAIAAGVLVGMGVGVVYKPWLIGKAIGHASWITASMIVSGPQRTSRRWLLAVVLLVGVSAGFQTVCFLGALTVYCLVRRQLRSWLPACFGVLAIYLLWRRAYATPLRRQSADASADTFASIPFHMFDVFNSAVARYLGISFGRAVFVTAVLGLVVTYRMVTKRSTHHEILAVLVIAVFCAAIVQSRILTGISPANAPRYTLPVLMFLILGLLPSVSLKMPDLRSPTGLLAVAILLIPMFWVLSTQRDTESAGFVFETRRSRATEDLVTTAAFLIREGIPFHADLPVRPRGQGGGTLRLRQLAGLVEDGLAVEPSTDDIAPVQATITIKTETSVTPTAEAECRTIAGRTPITTDNLVVAGAAGRSIEVGWTDLVGGPGSVQLTLEERGQMGLTFADTTDAGYWLDPLGGELQWCTEKGERDDS